LTCREIQGLTKSTAALSTVDTYLNLLATSRCYLKEVKSGQIQFHLFGSMLTEKLRSLGDKYDFLHMGSFLDKHYKSNKRMTSMSIMVFLLPEMALLVFDFSQKKFFVYDCYTRSLSDHAVDIQSIKKFVLDYIEVYGADYPPAKLPGEGEMEVVAGDCFKGFN
jgi:hypothetical protein